MTDRKDRIRVHIEGKEYNVVGGEFREMLAAVKQIVGRRFISESKVWHLPGKVDDIQNQLSISGYELAGGTPLADTPEPQLPTASQPSGNDRIRIKAGDYQLAVVGGTFQEMLDVVKKLPGRRFDGNNKVWEIPGDAILIKGMLEAAGFQIEGAEQLPVGQIRPMEPVPFTQSEQIPVYEPPDFGDATDAPPYEPPDWWDDDSMPPPLEPEGWDEAFGGPPLEEPDFNPPPTSFSAPRTSNPEVSSAASGDRIRLRIGETPFVVTGGSFQAMLAVIKNIPGRRFNGQEKVWQIPDDTTVDSVDQAMTEAGFTLMPE